MIPKIAANVEMHDDGYALISPQMILVYVEWQAWHHVAQKIVPMI